nr:hypothetical protein [Morchella crassipes]
MIRLSIFFVLSFYISLYKQIKKIRLWFFLWSVPPSRKGPAHHAVVGGGRQRLKEGGHFNHKMTTLFTPPSLHVMRGVEGGRGGRSSLWPPPPPPPPPVLS